jgi:O-antigen/teichoic acid export membrane protein
MSPPIPIGRFAAVWLIMAVAMSANGVVRELVFKREMNPGNADVLSAIVGVALIALITAIGFRSIEDQSASALLALSVALVVATVVFETALGRFVDHKSWSDVLGHYNMLRGELWPLVLAWLALTPFVWARWARRG